MVQVLDAECTFLSKILNDLCARILRTHNHLSPINGRRAKIPDRDDTQPLSFLPTCMVHYTGEPMILLILNCLFFLILYSYFRMLILLLYIKKKCISQNKLKKLAGITMNTITKIE
jgi:hypothetical protein